jgi:hypothetical protein
MRVPWKVDRRQCRPVFDERTWGSIFHRLGCQARSETSLQPSVNEKPPQRFLHHGLLAGELAVLDLTSQKLLEIVSKCDVHRGKSLPELLEVPTRPSAIPYLKTPCLGKVNALSCC